MKIYLDTNTIYGFFKEVIKSWEEHRSIEMPEKVKFLKSHEGEITYFISDIVYLELIKRIKYEYNLSEEKIENLLRIFPRTLNIRVVSRSSWFKETLFDDIFDLIKRNAFKIGLTDILHAYIAGQNNLILFTGDRALNDDAKKICGQAMNYAQLRKRLYR